MTTTAIHPLQHMSASLAIGSGEREDERAMVAKALSEPDGFAPIYTRHYSAVAGYIYRRLGEPHLTEDLTSEVFVAAMRALKRFRGEAPLRLWLLKIATNTMNRRLRALRRERARRVDLRAAPDKAGPDGSRPEMADELRRAQDLMLALPAKHQAVLSLVGVEGLTQEEAALVLGVRVGTVKSRLSRARVALRRLIERQERGS